MMKRKSGFSLVDVLIASLFLSMVLLGLMWMNSYSSKSSMDAYYEFLAFQIAMEPIEVFRSFGYEWLKQYKENTLPDFPLDKWVDLAQNQTMAVIRRPVECNFFQRLIKLEPVQEGSLNAIRVQVSVSPKDQSRIKSWLRRDTFTLSALIVEEMK